MKLKFRSIDTMKLSRDNTNLTFGQIQSLVNQYQGFYLSHLTVDCFLRDVFHNDIDRENWVRATRNAGFKVWWRPAYGESPPNSPEGLSEFLMEFPLRRPDLFENGDIFDPLPEGFPFPSSDGEQIFGDTVPEIVANWNAWMPGFMKDMRAMFASIGKSDVTVLTSITNFSALNYVTPETYQAMGYACIDHYPGIITSTPDAVARSSVSELTRLYNKAKVPVVVGEYGFVRDGDSNQVHQEEVLDGLFNALSKLDFLAGFNYWCGHGGEGYGSYCNLFESKSGAWVPRKATNAVRKFYINSRGNRVERTGQWGGQLSRKKNN